MASGFQGATIRLPMPWWKRWFGWLLPKKKSKVVPGVLGIPTPHTLMQKVSDVREEQERQMLRLAEESMRRGHPEQAVIVYRKAAARYHAESRPLKEAAVLQRIADLEENDAQVLGRLVEIYESLDRRIDAARCAQRLAKLLADTGRVAESQLYAAKADVLQANYGRPTPMPTPSPSMEGSGLKPKPLVKTPPPDEGPLELSLDEEGASSDSGVALGRIAMAQRQVSLEDHDEGEMPDVGRAAWNQAPAAEPIEEPDDDSDAFSLGGLSQVSEPVAPQLAARPPAPIAKAESDAAALSTPLPRRTSEVLEPREQVGQEMLQEPPIGGHPPVTSEASDDSIEDLNSLIDGQDPWAEESETPPPDNAEEDESNSTLFMPAVTKAALEADAHRSGDLNTVKLDDGSEAGTRAGIPKAVTLALDPASLLAADLETADEEEEEDDDEGAATLFMSAVRPGSEAKGDPTAHFGAIQPADTDVSSSDEHEEYESDYEDEDDDDEGASTLFMPQIDSEMAARARADAAKRNKPAPTNLRIPDEETKPEDSD